MILSKRIGIFLLAGIIGAFALELGERYLIPGGHSLVPSAEAVVGRPLTPVSVSGVARRTARRTVVATSIYIATLPPACTTVIIEGITLQQCGGTYYQASGTQYVVVIVE
jgi:hypothetical protein